MSVLFSSRRFWVIVVALVVMVIAAIIPGFALPEEQTAEALAVIAAFIISLAIDPGDPCQKWKGMLTSRRFWLAVVALAVIVGGVFVPGFTLPADMLVGMVIIVCTYIVSLALDPGDPRAKWAATLKSRKFWAALVGVTVTVLNAFGIALPVGMTADSMTALAVLVSGYIASVALDGAPELPEETGNTAGDETQ